MNVRWKPGSALKCLLQKNKAGIQCRDHLPHAFRICSDVGEDGWELGRRRCLAENKSFIQVLVSCGSPRARAFLISILAAAAIVAGGAGPAEAAAQRPFALHERVEFVATARTELRHPGPPADLLQRGPVLAPLPVGVESLSGVVAAIVECESGGENVTNPSSGASGYFQFMGSTWAAVTGLAPPASAYPFEVQLAAFEELWDGGAGASHWSASRHCWG